MEKSTHGFEERTLWQPLVKSNDGKYVAILSDNSVDRDDEIIGKKALQSILDNDGYTAILVDHENKIKNQIGEWVNKRLETIGEHTALVAEPKFYLSNPQAKMIKGMLDDGAKMGISIGAIPTGAIEKKCADGKTRKEFTGLELLEASFVAIPSNRHGQAMAVAKMLKSQENKMAEEITKEPIEETVEEVVVEKPVIEPVEEIKEEIKEAPKEEVIEVKANDELLLIKKELEATKLKVEELTKVNTAATKTLEESKAVLKAQHDTEEGNPSEQISKDAMPIFRK